MKLVALELSGFRGFAKTQVFDLDADAIVVVGANGNGKTSLFDGVLWAICGRIPRLSEENHRVLSLFSESGQARAALTLRDETDRIFKITRSVDGNGIDSRVSLETPEGSLAGPAAEGRLIQLIWSEAEVAAQPLDALASVLTRSVYLQQDVLRHFIDPASDQDRFTSVSELFGAGRVTELQLALERAKKAWSTSTNQRASDLEITQSALNTVDTRARDLAARVAQDRPTVEGTVWSTWWTNVMSVGVKTVTPELSSREASRSMDVAIKEIDSRRAAADRRLQAFRSLQTQLATIAATPAPADPIKLREDSTARVKELASLKEATFTEQSRLAEFRRMQTELKQKDEQLRVLASIALQHLGAHCPVCAQTYDRDATKRRLDALAGVKLNAAPTEPDVAHLNKLLAAVAAKENEIGNLELAIRSAERKSSEAAMLLEGVNARLAEVGITADSANARLEGLSQAIADSEALNTRLRALQQEGEALALRLAQSGAQAALVEARNEADRLRRAIVEQQQAVTSRNATGEVAQRIIDGLREAASTVVEQRLRQITPVLQNIYARIDPHPAFATVEFLTRVTRGRGLLSTVVKDPVENKQCPHPPSVLSSSQVNALAVSVFLSFNLGIARPPLAALLLDDPLQSLDDVNLLGLVDLLRRTKDRRQLCVSTHDARFASLLSRKLRPSDAEGRTIVIELEGWHREGPFVETREVKCDPVPLRLIAS